jgi:hypothetical protein
MYSYQLLPLLPASLFGVRDIFFTRFKGLNFLFSLLMFSANLEDEELEPGFADLSAND